MISQNFNRIGTQNRHVLSGVKRRRRNPEVTPGLSRRPMRLLVRSATARETAALLRDSCSARSQRWNPAVWRSSQSAKISRSATC